MEISKIKQLTYLANHCQK